MDIANLSSSPLAVTPMCLQFINWWLEVEVSFGGGSILGCYEAIAQLAWAILYVGKVALGSIAGLDG